MSSMSKHVRGVHCLLLTEYKDIYRDHKETIVKKIYHKCGLCQEVLLLDVLEIAIHLRRSKHDFFHKEYNARFMTYKVLSNSIKIKEDIEIKHSEERAFFYKGKYKKEAFKNLSTTQLLEEIDLVLDA